MRHSWIVALVLLAACNKPTPDNCRKALANIQHLMGTDNLLRDADFEGEVRRCRGGSTREAVDCAIKASSMTELKACEFTKTAATPGSSAPSDDSKPKDSGSGSAGGSGSAK